MKNRIIILASLSLMLAGCSDNTGYTCNGLFPDYSDVTIPCNIAPLNFRVGNAGEVNVTVKGKNGEFDKFYTKDELLNINNKKAIV